MKPLLFIALDDLSGKEEKTLKIVEQLSKVEGNFGFKINLDYLLNPGKGLKAISVPIQQFNRPVFFDIKIFCSTCDCMYMIEFCHSYVRSQRFAFFCSVCARIYCVESHFPVATLDENGIEARKIIFHCSWRQSCWN